MAGLPGVTSAVPSISQFTGREAGTAPADIAAAVAASPGVGPAYKLDLQAANDWTDPVVRQLKRTGRIECQTCKARKYQDGSDDSGVSFKAPGHISPEASAATVMAHEQEHVANEQANARSENRKVVSQSVRLFTAVCPECGKAYVSGGETRTVTKAGNSDQDQTGPNKVDMTI